MNRNLLFAVLLGGGFAIAAPAPLWAQEPAADEAAAQEPAAVELLEDTSGPATHVNALEIRYTAEQIRTIGGSVQLLDEETLSTMRYEDPNAILSQAAGVYIRAEDGYGLRPNIGMRGATSERSRKLTLMEDGILLLPSPYSAPAAYYFPLMPRMNGIEIFKGPSSILYGPETIGGAINFLTRDIPQGMAGQLTVGFGTDMFRQVHLWHGLSDEWGGILAEVVHVGSNGFKELDNDDRHTGFDRWDAMLKARLNLPSSGRFFNSFELKFTLSTERSNETYFALTDADFEDNPVRRYAATQMDRMESDRWTLQLSHQFRFDVGDLTTTAYRNAFTRDWAKINRFMAGPSFAAILNDPNAPANQRFYDLIRGDADSVRGVDEDTFNYGSNAREHLSEGVQSIARLHFEDRLQSELEVGVRYHHDYEIRNHTAMGLVMEGGQIQEDGSPEVVVADAKANARALAAHALYSGSVGGFTFSPGVRMEWIETEREDYLKDTEDENSTLGVMPGLGLHYAITPEFGVLAGVYRGFSPVGPGQPDDVRPEYSINSEAGVRWQQRSGSNASVVGFLNEYQNMTGECSLSGGCTEDQKFDQFNAGRARVYGAEVIAGHAFQLGQSRVWLPINLAYTWSASEFLEAFKSDNSQYGSVEPGDEMPYLPAHQANLRVGVEEPGHWGVYVSTSALSKMREEAGTGDDTRFTDAFVRVDVAGSYTFWRTMTAFLRFDNVTNTQPVVSRRPYGARSILPFSVRGELSYAW